jgi:hypothetical protein
VLWTVRRSLVVWDRNHRVRKPTPMEYNVAHRGLWGYQRRHGSKAGRAAGSADDERREELQK